MASVAILAASQYLMRLEEDLIEWRGLPELLVFPLKDIELISPDFAALGTITRLDEQDKQRTILFAAQSIKELALGKPRVP
jgi:hypothetical protein